MILACHADEALKMLDTPTTLERETLGEFKYQRNKATLHTDASLMPKTKLAWSSWNYRLDTDANGNSRSSTIYHMNTLQNVSKKRDYFISIDDPGTVDPGSILREIDYTHPVFSLGAITAQKELPMINNGRSRVLLRQLLQVWIS